MSAAVTTKRPWASVGDTKVHVWFCLLGLFSASWDRLANVTVGTFNVKLPVVAYAVCLALSLLDGSPTEASRPQRAIRAAVAALVVAYLLGTALADMRQVAVTQFVTLALGALMPYWAVLRTIRLGESPLRLLRAFILGGVVAALFGFYQLAASYTGLPDPIPYYGRAGGVGRISSFSYEPAYFAYFLVLVLAALFAWEALTGERFNRWVLPLVFAAIVLSNSRAMVIMVPLFFALLFLRVRHLKALDRMTGPLLLAVGLVTVGLLASESLRTFLSERIGSIVDPSEQTSNAPRLNSYDATVDLIRDNWLTGVGPGNLYSAGPWYGLTPSADATPNAVIANNIWLQAAVDGGIWLFAATLALVVVVGIQLYRRALPATRCLAAGWLSVVLVGGMLTSYFYDLKLWAILGLAAGLAGVRTPAAPLPSESARPVTPPRR